MVYNFSAATGSDDLTDRLAQLEALVRELKVQAAAMQKELRAMREWQAAFDETRATTSDTPLSATVVTS
jgi:type II secretory pathway component PulM